MLRLSRFVVVLSVVCFFVFSFLGWGWTIFCVDDVPSQNYCCHCPTKRGPWIKSKREEGSKRNSGRERSRERGGQGGRGREI